MANPFTTMRQSARDAISNFAATKNAFKYKQFFDDAPAVSQLDFSPPVNKLPALIAYPQPSTMPWILHSSKEVRYVLQMDIWTPHWSLPVAEELYWDTCRALYQAAETDGGQTYIRAATGQYPEISGFAIVPQALGENSPVRATKLSFTCTLRKTGVNPITQT